MEPMNKDKFDRDLLPHARVNSDFRSAAVEDSMLENSIGSESVPQAPTAVCSQVPFFVDTSGKQSPPILTRSVPDRLQYRVL